MLFVYRDRAGDETLRKLTSFKDDGVYLRGYCEYSGGVRTFRKDRIVEVLDGDEAAAITGAAMPDNAGRRDTVDEDYRWEICFTGFGKLERKDLETVARSSGMQVRTVVTRNLNFLCIGDNASLKKMQEAEGKGCLLITDDQFYEFVNDGVLPEGSSAKKKTARWREISAVEARQYFADWAYTIKEAHWAALGIQWREFIDKERTAALRAWWDTENPHYVAMTKRRKAASAGEYKKRISEHPEHAAWSKLNAERLGKVYKYPARGISDPLEYDFHEGDLFFCGSSALQVAHDYAPLEVKFHHASAVLGYHLTEKDFAKWLRTGVAAPDTRRIEKNQSKSAIAQFYEYTE